MTDVLSMHLSKIYVTKMHLYDNLHTAGKTKDITSDTIKNFKSKKIKTILHSQKRKSNMKNLETSEKQNIQKSRKKTECHESLDTNKNKKGQELRDKKQRGTQSENNSIIGAALKALRTGQDLKQQDLAANLEISVSAYSHYECGERTPDLISLIRISNLYTININYLVLLTSIDIAKKSAIDINDIFKAFSYSKTLEKEEANILSVCKRLSPAGKKNLKIFLTSVIQAESGF